MVIGDKRDMEFRQRRQILRLAWRQPPASATSEPAASVGSAEVPFRPRPRRPRRPIPSAGQPVPIAARATATVAALRFAGKISIAIPGRRVLGPGGQEMQIKVEFWIRGTAHLNIRDYIKRAP